MISLVGERATAEPERRTDTQRPSFSKFPPEIRCDVETEEIMTIAGCRYLADFI